MICAFEQDGLVAKAEEWLLRALASGIVPSEASFNAVVLAHCNMGAPHMVEEVMSQMKRYQVRPAKELFDVVIRMFADKRDPHKVEEWLLNAGQSGWTPEQAAFESVVLLYAEADPTKAEEWLTRAQQTEYRLPDVCFSAIVEVFLRVGNAPKVNEWLSWMLAEGRSPSVTMLTEVVSLHIQTGNVPRAEAWLGQLAGRSTVPVEDLRKSLFDEAMRAKDIPCAERQLMELLEPSAERTLEVANFLVEAGDPARAKELFEHYFDRNGPVVPALCSGLLATCAATSDASGAERAARALTVAAGPLNSVQSALLQQALGYDAHATELLAELGAAPPEPAIVVPGSPKQVSTPQPQRMRPPSTSAEERTVVHPAESGRPGSGRTRQRTGASAGPSPRSGTRNAATASAKSAARRNPTMGGTNSLRRPPSVK